MIKVKHLMDTYDDEDGARLWVEPIGLTRDLQEWCRVDHLLSHVGPPVGLWEWLAEHPDGYAYFRATYHEWLAKSKLRPALSELAAAGHRQTFTLIHASDDASQNVASALADYLTELHTHQTEG